jgi:2'-phosphotransferase
MSSQASVAKRPWGPTCGSWLFDRTFSHVALAVTATGALGPLKGSPELEDQLASKYNPKATCVREVMEESSIAAHEWHVVPGYECHIYNDKNNLSIRCWVGVYPDTAGSRRLATREGDELEAVVWMPVQIALDDKNLAPQRRTSLSQAHTLLETLSVVEVADLPLASVWVQVPLNNETKPTVYIARLPASAKSASAASASSSKHQSYASAKHQSTKRQGGGGGGSAPTNQELKRHTELSKALSWLLRHHAHEFPMLELRADGYVRLDRVLSEAMWQQVPRLRNATMEDVRRVVTSCPKQRFQLIEGEKNVWLIRSTQGHSQNASKHLDPKQLMKRQLDRAPDTFVMHGTESKFRASIEHSGLSRMSREYIHMTTHLPESGEAVSGMRAGCDMVVFVNVAQAMAESEAAQQAARDAPDDAAAQVLAAERYIEFYESVNGVIQTTGCGTSGCIPPHLLTYCSRAEASARIAASVQTL